MLVGHGADPLETDGEGKTSLDIALLPDIQKILVDPPERCSYSSSCTNTSPRRSPEQLLDSYRSRADSYRSRASVDIFSLI